MSESREGEFRKRIREDCWEYKVNDNVMFNMIDEAAREFPYKVTVEADGRLRIVEDVNPLGLAGWLVKWFGVPKKEEKEAK